MMKISFSSLGDPKKPLADFVALLAAEGYDAIELRGRPGEHVHWQDSADRRKEVVKILADAGMEAAAISTYIFSANRDAGGPDKPDHRDEAGNIEELKHWVDLASDLGAKNVRLFGGALTEGETHDDALPRVARIMDAGAAVNPDINICIECHDVWNTGAIVSKVLDATSHENCKALLDVHGPQHADELPEVTIPLLQPERIAYLHLKDYFMAPREPGGKRQMYQCFIGAGTTPIRRTIQLLKDAGWSGYLNIEWEGVYHKYMPAVEAAIIQGILKIKEFLAE